MTSLAQAEAFDRDDPLKEMRKRFDLPEGVIYLDGNSLGALPKGVAARVATTIQEEWGRDLIKSWNTADWYHLPRRVGDKIAGVVGAGPGTVVVTDSTSVNLFKVLSAALAMNADSKVIVSERGNFPTDLYIAEGLIKQLNRNHTLRLVDSADEVPNALDESVAVLMLTEVNYRSGFLHDMATLTRLAHDKGILTVWDLSHSAGAIPVDLTGSGADFAVGCGYKYLNGGPGAPAFLYVAPRHQEEFAQPLSGWFGHKAPFAFESSFAEADGIARALCGTRHRRFRWWPWTRPWTFGRTFLQRTCGESRWLSHLSLSTASNASARGRACSLPRGETRSGAAARFPSRVPTMVTPSCRPLSPVASSAITARRIFCGSGSRRSTRVSPTPGRPPTLSEISWSQARGESRPFASARLLPDHYISSFCELGRLGRSNSAANAATRAAKKIYPAFAVSRVANHPTTIGPEK